MLHECHAFGKGNGPPGGIGKIVRLYRQFRWHEDCRFGAISNSHPKVEHPNQKNLIAVDLPAELNNVVLPIAPPSWHALPTAAVMRDTAKSIGTTE